MVATSVPVGGKSVVSQTSSSLYGELIPGIVHVHIMKSVSSINFSFHSGMFVAGKKLRLSVSQSLSSLAVSPNHCCVVGVTNIGNLSLFRFSLRTLGLPSGDLHILSLLIQYNFMTFSFW